MKKTLALLFLLSFFRLPVMCDFWEDEKLIGVLDSKTGYSLNKCEKMIGIGPLGYGITDKFMLRTNFLSALLGTIELEAKYEILKEKGSTPGVALAADYMNTIFSQFIADSIAEEHSEEVESIKAGLWGYMVSLAISKSLTDKLTCHSNFGTVYRDFLWEVKTKPGKADPTKDEKEEFEKAIPGTNIYFSADYKLSKKVWLLSSLGYDLYFKYVSAGAGIIWASKGISRIELGLLYPSFDPHVSIYWRW